MLPRLGLRIPIYRLNGVTRYGNSSGTLVFAGNEVERNFIVNRFFAGPFKTERLARVSTYALPAALAQLRNMADLTVARVVRPVATQLQENDFLCAPEAVDCEVEVSATTEASAMLLNTKTAKHNSKVVRDNALSWTVSHDLSDCDVFIETMYVPYVAKRYGHLGVRKAISRVRRQFRHGGLIFVWHDGVRIAGGTVVTDGSVLRSGVLGTLGGRKQLLALGAISALYLFGAEYARQLGLRRFNFGSSVPSLASSVLRHKCSWGGHIIDRKEAIRDYAIGWRRVHDGLVEFFKHTPLILRDVDGLSVLSASTSSADAAGLARLAKRARNAGLQRTILLEDLASPLRRALARHDV